MKVCIITFHWATNYGAVLQTYALSEALKQYGAEVDVVDYYPKKYKKNYFNALKTRHVKSIKRRLKDIDKDKLIESFRIKHLNRTRYYSTNLQLKKHLPEYDCYICGSDQIWNMSFIMHGELRNTFVYFLDFAPEGKVLASYAASFGTTKCDVKLKDDIKQCLERFDFISLREETGVRIVNDMGIANSGTVPDPTLLFDSEHYDKLLDNTYKKQGNFVYMLHNRLGDANGIIDCLKKKSEDVYFCDDESVEQWIADIKNADRVITNSFHGTVFSILYRKQFATILINGSGMNDRLITLLERLGLEDRIYNGNPDMIDKPVDWSAVEQKIDGFRKIGIDYIEKILGSEER